MSKSSIVSDLTVIDDGDIDISKFGTCYNLEFGEAEIAAPRLV